tara:strand:+ start:284 stop:550 length:267 start_codon:yes stop_codon:yes gene_type:complete
MSDLVAVGTIKEIFKTQQINERFKKRGLLLDNGSERNNLTYVEFTQGQCAILEKYATGDNVAVCFNVNAKEHKGKFYTSLFAYKIAHT